MIGKEIDEAYFDAVLSQKLTAAVIYRLDIRSARHREQAD